MPIDFNKLVDESGRLFLAEPNEASAFLYLRATLAASLTGVMGWEATESVLKQVLDLVPNITMMIEVDVAALSTWVEQCKSAEYRRRNGVVT